ncbi:MAG TPA: pantoate--beta-alanine ligase [Candidatus Koribacter sp.]|jgi:glycerol-3-phosphate cytidylyltransferase
MRIGITFGTFDLLHIGHINILERSKQACDYLVVGVSTDALNFSKKKAYPVYSEDERVKIISSLRMVDQVFLEESLEKKRDYIQQFKANVLIMGDDWAGRFDFCSDLCEVLYLPRTPHISTTSVKAEIFTRHVPHAQVKSAGK